jgi:hypothetical protein
LAPPPDWRLFAPEASRQRSTRIAAGWLSFGPGVAMTLLTDSL